MGIGKRIKHIREELNITQDELAKMVGYRSRTTINKIENEINDVRQSKIQDFAKALRVTPAYLLGWEDEDEDDEEESNALRIPVLGEVIAGIPIEAVEDILDYEEVPASWESQGDFFALRIKGDSMEPRMEAGDVVIVRQQTTADNGDTVIVLVNGDSATCKKLKKTDSGIMLISTNIEYEPLFYTWQEVESLPVQIIGKVVELRQKY